MRPTLRQLEYILAVAETGHISQAADRLNVSQPSLSAQLADAEAELGTTLFHRSRAGSTPTAAGEEVIARARIVLDAMERLRDSVQRDSLFQGRLRLGVLPSIGPYLLPGVVQALHRDNPDFRLLIREEATRDLDAGLRDGRLDVAVSTPEDHPGLPQLPLFSEAFWIGLAEDHPLAQHSGPIPLTALAGEILLTIGQRHRLSHIVRGLAQTSGARVLDDYEGTSLDAIRLMAASGAGIAILPQIYAMTEARRGTDLVLRKLDHPTAQRDIVLVRSVMLDASDAETLAQTLRSSARAILASPQEA